MPMPPPARAATHSIVQDCEDRPPLADTPSVHLVAEMTRTAEREVMPGGSGERLAWQPQLCQHWTRSRPNTLFVLGKLPSRCQSFPPPQGQLALGMGKTQVEVHDEDLCWFWSDETNGRGLLSLAWP